jgi:hypothetical protein
MVIDKKITSLFLTAFVISVLIISGPAQAITLGISEISDLTPEEQSEISFVAKIDLHENDVVALKNITANIKNNDNTVNATCTFSLNGNKLSCDSSFGDIELVSSNIEYNDSHAGYGYGYASGGYINESFGYGYQYIAGYGYDEFSNSITTTAELVYNIEWTTPGVSSETSFSIEILANADDGTNTATYKTKTAQQITVEPETSSPSPGGGSGNYERVRVIYIGGKSNQVNLGKNDVGKFRFKGAFHRMKFSYMGQNRVTIVIYSTPKTVSLDVGESAKVDITDDGYYDLHITLDDIRNSMAYMIVDEIHEKIPTAKATADDTEQEQPVEEETTESEQQTDETEQTTPTGEAVKETKQQPPVEIKKFAWAELIVIVLIVFFIGLLGYFIFTKKHTY